MYFILFVCTVTPLLQILVTQAFPDDTPVVWRSNKKSVLSPGQLIQTWPFRQALCLLLMKNAAADFLGQMCSQSRTNVRNIWAMGGAWVEHAGGRTFHRCYAAEIISFGFPDIESGIGPLKPLNQISSFQVDIFVWVSYVVPLFDPEMFFFSGLHSSYVRNVISTPTHIGSLRSVHVWKRLR